MMPVGNIRYSPHYGQQNALRSDAMKKRTKYLCNHPNGGAVTHVVIGVPPVNPVALWYKDSTGWRLSTVVDKDHLPDWAANYKQFYARRA